MKNKLIILTIAFALTQSGCVIDEEGGNSQNSEIILSMSGPTALSAKSRAPVDSLNNTPVSVGYVFAPNTIFDRSLTVPVTQETGEHINTGLAYPDDNSIVSFIGYHPVATPNEVGTVTYDLSKGDVDVMVSNSVSGSLHNTIMYQGETLILEHMLTRVTFRLRCAQGQSYPEPVFGIRASASSAEPLNTAVTFDLAAEGLTFKTSGMVFSGNPEGFVIPLYGASPILVEVMLQPRVPLVFTVSSLTGDRGITITSDPDPNRFWEKLMTEGGERGKQYIVDLSFSGEMILAQDIAVVPWIGGTQNLGGGQIWW